ncbi:MAG: HDOD domain-containing protein [Deltaproteobacteria bacterium]|nr:HDOD domain-containing protein [Deltaproteobacteria bacterium]MBN2671406.1 HDOD domain-containing protein [Deltaproteobacteria bacterium]
MPNIPLESLTPGMTTIADVVNRRGQILIPSGAEISERHMKGLKMWGIESVDIDASDLSDEYLAHDASLRQLPSDGELDEYLKVLFRHNLEQRQHPLVKELWETCRRHFSQQGIPEVKQIQKNGHRVEGGSENEVSRKDRVNASTMLKRSANLASPPDLYAKLMEVMERGGSSSSHIAGVISKDPSLTARLLKIVNSAYYSFPSAIETISRAITIVGTDELRNMVLVTSVIKNFSSSLEGILNMEQFWKHSIACALFSKQLAKLRNDQNAERFFTTGLLHDIGRLIMYLQIPDTMTDVIFDSDTQGETHRIERRLAGFTHAGVGAELAENWKLSARQHEAIRYHHNPQRAKRFPTDTAILHLADALSIALQIGSSGSRFVPLIDIEIWEQLHLPADSFFRIAQDVQKEVNELIQIFYENSNERN